MAGADYLEVWYAALAAQFGVVVETDDPARLKQKLYAARQGHPDFEGISIKTSPFHDNQLWLVKRNPDEEERGSPDPKSHP